MEIVRRTYDVPAGRRSALCARTCAPARRLSPLTVLLSDLHLGRGSADATRAAERDAVALLRAHAPDVGPDDAVVLLGDVFDRWIEYRHAAPKLGVRLLGTLADLADGGTRVVYTVGNRDPWHVDLLASLGVAVFTGGARLRLGGHDVYLSHGDRDLPARGALGRLSHRFLPLLRRPTTARLYRSALPGDAGLALARAVALGFGTDGEVDAVAADALAASARARLAAPGGPAVVAHGHVHEARLEAGPDGAYLNPGYWFGDRTFARLSADGPTLWRWADGRALPL